MNHRTPPNPDLEALPAELHPLYAALVEDGAAWRRETPDLGPRLDAFARDLATQPAPGTTITFDLDGDSGTLPSVPSAWRASRRDRQPPRSRRAHPDRRRGLLAVAAMAAVIVLLIALFHTMLPPRQIHHGPPLPPSPAPHGTATPAITPGPRGQWQPLNALAYSSPIVTGGGPAIAPSNPLVVYEPVAPTAGHPATMRRTEDGGKSWVTLPLPYHGGAAIGWFGAIVSPLDPRIVYLTIEVNNPASCPPPTSYPRGASSPGSGIGPCVFNFVSTEAGSQWLPLNLSVNLGIGLGADAAKPGLVAQGARLYATGTDACAGEKSMLCMRILTSTDGVSWTAIDHYLTVDQSQFVCDWTATPQGTTVFAITGARGVEGCSYYPQSVTLWRSDDVGVTWTRVGTLPSPNIRGLVATGGGDAPIALYANLPATVGTSVDNLGYTDPVLSDVPGDLRASTDGGKTWQRAPGAGIGGGLLPGAEPLGVLSNGAVLMPFTGAGSADGGNPTFYAWAAGAGRWQLVAPAGGFGAPQSVLVMPVAGQDTLWVVVPEGDASSGTYRVYAYTT